MNTRQRGRTGATSYSPAPIPVGSPSIAPPQLDGQKKAEAVQTARAIDNVRQIAIEGASILETVVLSGQRYNPWDTAGLINPAVITFLVPPGRVFSVEKIGWRFTDPAMHELFSDHMEIWVNGQRVPWYRDGGVDIDPVGPPIPVTGNSLSPVGFQWPFGSITEPMPINPLYIPENNLFEVRLVQGTAGGDFVAMSVRVVGRLRKAAGGMA